jgi:flagellar basal-body rod modification protein FlgD
MSADIPAVSAPAAANDIAGTVARDKSLDKTAFLKLLVAQMKNQDPLKPMDNTEFVAQLAQFSNLEQVMGINDRLDALTLQGQGQANTEVASLVGKRITANGTSVGLDSSGTGVSIAFQLQSPSAATQVLINDSSGKTIRTLDVGAKGIGVSKIVWDGKSDEGVTQPPGGYTVAVSAKASNGAPIPVTQNTTANVTAVSFNKGYPELELDNGLSVPVADLLRVEASPPTTTVP